METSTTDTPAADTTTSAAVIVPEGMSAVTFNYSFRRFENTPENREKQLSFDTADHEIEDVVSDQVDEEGAKTGIELFKRKTESVRLLVPTPEALGIPVLELPENPTDEQKAEVAESAKQAKVMQSIISSHIEALGRTLVNKGITPTPDNCNWQIAYSLEAQRLEKTGTSKSGVTFNKDLLDDVADSFADYCRAMDAPKPEKGIVIMQKMIKGRFNAMSTRKWIKGMDDIIANISDWYVNGLDEDQQDEYKEVTAYLLDRAEASKEPEVEDTTSLF